MISYSCQICGVDMAIARIRTTEEPTSAAWSINGANYVGWVNWLGTEEEDDQPCQDCTTTDRTPADAEILEWESRPRWPEADDPDDLDWVPDERSYTDEEPLEYDSEFESERFDSSPSKSNLDENTQQDSTETVDENSDAGSSCAVSELCNAPLPTRLPHGTWHKNKVYYTGNREKPIHGGFHGRNGNRVPPEHVASPSCQSLKGINAHMLSLDEMKNCRNVRFLIPKPKEWKPEADDQLLESDSLFYLSGETNGSHTGEDGFYLPWRSLYPPRHGVQEVRCDWTMVNVGVNGSDVLCPLPVHSYCLDIYVKLSYSRVGKVDLDGLWHWREIESDPHSYMKGQQLPLQHPAVLKGREDWSCAWDHYPGDEWLAANPLEIPAISQALATCQAQVVQTSCQPQVRFLTLPTELMHHILELLEPDDLDAISQSCQRMYHLAQPGFKEIVVKDMVWLWEILEGSRYPASLNSHVLWDPLCPLGMEPPELPVGLESEETESSVWAQIVADFPEMEEVGQAVKAANIRRRNEIRAPYQAKLDSLFHKWQRFRAGVEKWICQSRNGDAEVDWRRTWRLFNPTTTSLPGIRNRARIWERCEQIMDCVALARRNGEIDNKQGDLLEKLADPTHPGWYTNPEADGWDL